MRDWCLDYRFEELGFKVYSFVGIVPQRSRIRIQR